MESLNKILERTTEDGLRFYIDSDTNEEYISVTSLLSKYEDNSGLEFWRRKVGEEEAALVTKKAIERGVSTHSIIDTFLTTREFKPNLELDIVNTHASHAIEYFYSNTESVDTESVITYNDSRVRYAGRYDSLVNILDGKFKFKDTGEVLKGGLSITDLKTKNNIPSLNRIDYVLKYVLQGSAYITALEKQRPGLSIDYFTVVFTSDKKARMIIFNREYIYHYFDIFYTLLLDYYSVFDNLNVSWSNLISMSNCSYDFETDTHKSYAPREIVLIR